MEFKAYIMDSAAVNRAIARISHEIIERNGDSDEICLVGIMRRGAPLADILASKIESLGVKTQKGYLDITLYRDDLSESASQPTVNSGKLDFSVEGKTVVMVDDVLYLSLIHIYMCIRDRTQRGRQDDTRRRTYRQTVR